MEIRDVEAEIIRQIEGNDGFLVQLHSGGVFEEEKYRALITSLETYDRLLGDEEVINRYLAGCLFQLESGLNDAHAKLANNRHPDEPRAGDAAVEVWDLLVRLLTPPRMR